MSKSGHFIRIAALVTLAATGCRTRPWELDSDGGSDLARRAPDLSVADLVVRPDLRPPPDLILPFVCRDIWLIDENGTFSGFDTRSRTFTDVGPLRCPARPNTGPMTMGVARDGNAWVLYNDGELFRVDVRTAACAATGFDRNQITIGNFVRLGSAFSADQPGSASETLFVLVGAGDLARLDTRTLQLTRIAPLGLDGELTGTGDAELWGFFPDLPSYVARIDKQTATLSQRINLPQIQSMQANAFAFSFWGGSFWVFLAEGGGDTTVYRIDKQSGALETVLANTKRHIVGAGVSSCAPLGLDL